MGRLSLLTPLRLRRMALATASTASCWPTMYLPRLFLESQQVFGFAADNFLNRHAGHAGYYVGQIFAGDGQPLGLLAGGVQLGQFAR